MAALTGGWKREATLRFWRFVAERHQVFRRRILERRFPPWTHDPVLQSVYFTNVYRELDRGTRYVINRLINLTPPLAFFNVVAYRAFNTVVAHQALAAALGDAYVIKRWSLPQARHALLRIQRSGERVFTGAFLVTGSGQFKARWAGKIGLVTENLTTIWRHHLRHVEALEQAETLEAAHQLLTKLPGVGTFLAYELVCDFMYRPSSGVPLLKFSEDDWVNMGPGARRGLSILTGRRFTRKDGAAAIAELRWSQRQWLKDAGVELRGPDLTLRNVEHSLCEFQKYERSRRGGRAKRGYDPHEANRALTPWMNLDEKFL